jgi:serine phosphatase RsbU (regulator of sigma subunit)/TPR repeat protein
MTKIKKIKLLVFLQIVIFVAQTSGQNAKRDSLWTIFNNKLLADTTRLNALTAISKSYIYNNPDTAIVLAKKSLGLAKQKNSIKHEALSFQLIGISFVMKSNFDLAIPYFHRSLVLAKKINHQTLLCYGYTYLGIVYWNQSNFPKALENYLLSLKISEAIHDKKGISACNNNIGLIYMDKKEYTKALEYFQKALKLNIELKDKNEIGSAYCNIGNVYLLMLDYPKALYYMQLSLKLRKEVNNEKGIGLCYAGLGATYKAEHKYTDAVYFFEKCYEVYKKIGDMQGVAGCFVNLGELHNDIGNFKSAKNYSEQAIELGKEIGDVNIEKIAHGNLSFAYSKLGNFEYAYKHHLKFKELTDSVFNIDNSKNFSDIKTTFEVEKKEIELKNEYKVQQVINLEEKKQQLLIIYSVGFLLFIVVVFLGLLYKRFKLTSKQKIIIELKEQETQKQNDVISRQKHLVEEKHKEITDSINYAERIQRSFLASDELLDEHLKNYFVFFQPKDVVSGDFYWASFAKASENNGRRNLFYLATADSTGHGVPGAIMSLLNITSIESAIKDGNTSPADILNATRKTIIDRLKKDGSAEGGKDGMDCSLICFNFVNSTLTYSSANNPVWIVRENNLIELAPDKMPVGKHDKDQTSFTQHEFHLQKGDTVYTLTDGLPDQFGGPNGKKYKYKQLKELLTSIATLPAEIQKEKLKESFVNWKGNLEQVDDVCVIGIRI